MQAKGSTLNPVKSHSQSLRAIKEAAQWGPVHHYPPLTYTEGGNKTFEQAIKMKEVTTPGLQARDPSDMQMHREIA